jgi:chromosome partitioning protein
LRVVTFYNHKGGVSKTTTAFNLGVYLSYVLNKKVLLVDADPQSNLTEQFFAPPSSDEQTELPGTSIFGALNPRFAGATSRIDAKRIVLPSHEKYTSLHLLRGDWSFSLAERYFANAISLAITETVHEKYTYVVFYNLIQDLIAEYEFDHVVVDLGPSSGAITNICLLTCDGYFIPVTPDRFCTQAVVALAKLIKIWIQRHETTIRTFPPYGIDSFPGQPYFLGAVSQNFKAYAGRTTKPYEYWESEILKILRSELVPVVPHLNDGTAYVATIKDFGGLAPVAHVVGKAIFDLDRQDTTYASQGGPWSGVALDSWLARAEAYGTEIAKIAEVVINV